MTRLARIAGAALVIAALSVLGTVARAQEQVDLLLVLSSDVSRSVDHPKFLLQREGGTSGITPGSVGRTVEVCERIAGDRVETLAGSSMVEEHFIIVILFIASGKTYKKDQSGCERMYIHD